MDTRKHQFNERKEQAVYKITLSRRPQPERTNKLPGHLFNRRVWISTAQTLLFDQSKPEEQTQAWYSQMVFEIIDIGIIALLQHPMRLVMHMD